MTPAETILKMIEEVDPNDTAKLDEIDLLASCYVMGGTVDSYCRRPGVFVHGKGYYPVTKYTRSRDALKAIRPKGCKLDGISNRFFRDLAVVQGEEVPAYDFQFTAHCDHMINAAGRTFTSPPLPTEELAELAAIIQAIDFESRPHPVEQPQTIKEQL